MSPQLTWIVVITAIVLAAVAWFVMNRRRTELLRQRFGPEYDRTAREIGDVRKAEAALEARARRVDKLHIRPLTPDDAARFGNAWGDVQRRFVDDPAAATIEADRLVGDVMHTRGYPVGDFDQRVEDVSVDHPHVVANYRAARAIVRRHAEREATTEDLRQAFVYYRALFSELLETAPEPQQRITQDERELARGRQ
jgi:hypothetical protein